MILDSSAVEQLTVNQLVAGSNPARGAIYIFPLHLLKFNAPLIYFVISGGMHVESIGELAGYIAAILATLTFLPQVLKTLRTRESKSLSGATITLSFFGNMCWLINGLAYNNISLIFSGIFIMLLLIPLIWVKYDNDELIIKRSKVQDFITRAFFITPRTDP